MRYIYSILIFLLMLCACNKDASEIGSLLNGIEAYIEEHVGDSLYPGHAGDRRGPGELPCLVAGRD